MRYIDADKLLDEVQTESGCIDFSMTATDIRKMIREQPTADVVEIGKPYFYEEGYVLKDFHNDGVRYFVIERAEE